ncbi:hypothetical protein MPLSOD_100340 [Mesorhizobium sp. SOD10]|nr:hypothetical protein MPLSOD_100340 [Mesorhizobium sp. SOD10]
MEASSPLQDLDLVTVGIVDEEEAGDQRPVVVELDDPLRIETERADPVVLAVEIGDRDGEMAVSVTKRIGLGAPLVHGQFHLERRTLIAEIDQREGLEIEPLRDLEPEGFVVEIDGPRLVENPDHGMDRLRQIGLRELHAFEADYARRRKMVVAADYHAYGLKMGSLAARKDESLIAVDGYRIENDRRRQCSKRRQPTNRRPKQTTTGGTDVQSLRRAGPGRLPADQQIDPHRRSLDQHPARGDILGSA